MGAVQLGWSKGSRQGRKTLIATGSYLVSTVPGY